MMPKMNNCIKALKGAMEFNLSLKVSLITWSTAWKFVPFCDGSGIEREYL